MSSLDRILNVNEKVLWRGKPAREAFLLRSLGGIPFGVIFLIFFFMWVAGVPFMVDLPIMLALLLAGWGFGVIVVPPIWQLKNLQNTDYMITDRRLIIQTWSLRQKVWWANLSEIKEIGVKMSLVDKLLRTRTVYPITPSYPFAPGMRFNYTRGGAFRVHKLPNPATGEFEEFSEMQVWWKTSFRPCLQALKQPYEGQKLLQEATGSAQKPKSQTAPPIVNFDQSPANVQVPQVNPSQKGYGTKQKLALLLGASLLLLGMLVFAFGYFTNYTPYVSYDNGYTYIDYIALFGFAFGGTGALILFVGFFRRFVKWAREHGAMVRGS